MEDKSIVLALEEGQKAKESEEVGWGKRRCSAFSM